MKCEIDDSRVFLQVIRESKSPLAILREALSNSYDAGATRARIKISGESNCSITFEISDNGSGIRPSEFRFFFGLGFGNKVGQELIGNKGLGTKLYFNGKRIEVVTRLRSGQSYRAILENPIGKLEAGEVPIYDVSKANDIPLPYRHGTVVTISGLKHSLRSPMLSLENTANYLKWFTVAGSCHRFFHIKGSRAFSVQLTRMGAKSESCTITGHELPGFGGSRCSEHDRFAAAFDPFIVSLRNDAGDKVGLLEVAGSIVGPEGHIVVDRRIKKRFKGVFLARDYFIVKNVSSEIFGGTGEWQNVHIVANCQQLLPSLSRDDLVEKTPGSVYAESISALREFSLAFRRGEPFRYRGLTIEHGSSFAGKYYAMLKSLRETESSLEENHLRTLDIVAMSGMPRTKLANDGGPVFEPIDHLGVLLVFQALVSKGVAIPSLGNLSVPSRFRVLGPTGAATSNVLVQKSMDGKAWSSPRTYRPALSLEEIPERDLEGIDGVICWNAGTKTPDLRQDLDVLCLGNIV